MLQYHYQNDSAKRWPVVSPQFAVSLIEFWRTKTIDKTVSLNHATAVNVIFGQALFSLYRNLHENCGLLCVLFFVASVMLSLLVNDFICT